MSQITVPPMSGRFSDTNTSLILELDGLFERQFPSFHERPDLFRQKAKDSSQSAIRDFEKNIGHPDPEVSRILRAMARNFAEWQAHREKNAAARAEMIDAPRRAAEAANPTHHTVHVRDAITGAIVEMTLPAAMVRFTGTMMAEEGGSFIE